MERRSRRGRHSVREERSPTLPARGRGSSTKTTSPIKVKTPIVIPPPSEPAPLQDEVVLNARGMPARQRKKNRYYYDEEVMITPDTMKARAQARRIKQEQLEVETEDEEPAAAYSTTYTTSQNYDSSTADEEEEEDDRSPSPAPPVIKVSGSSKTSSPKRRRVQEEESPAADKGKKAETPVKAGRGRPKKVKDDDKESRKKVKEAPQLTAPQLTAPSEETPKKPKMQFIRIKREPDMSLSSPQHVIYEGTPDDASYVEEMSPVIHQQQRRGTDGKKNYQQIDVRTIKQDYSDAEHSLARSQYGYGDYGITARTGFIKPEAPAGMLDKKTAHDISIRLRNLLKLPKAHKWVCYEWFYSNIDKVLFEGENDFQICLKESFPQLKARKMARVEWCKVRRLMGKPRRCSQSFFDEEREELGRRRQKIRMIQQRKVTDFNYKELPDEIPLQLVIGTKVTSRLRKPQDGLFTGTIDGVDTSNNTYRITFDRAGLGTHSIPDYEVLSNETPETVSTSSFAMKIPRRNYGFSSGTFKFQNPLLMGEEIPGFAKSPFPVDGMLGGFPIRLLDMIVRLSKLLKGKREKILHLKELNVEAEKLRSYGKSFNDDYRIRYARVVVDLESMNKEMGMYLEGIQQYCLEIAPDHGSYQMIIPEHIQEACRQEAALIVDTYNTNKSRSMVHGNKSLQLIADMTSLLLQVKALSSGDRSLYELKSIKDTLGEIKAGLSGRNVQLFQDRVEIPMNRIQTGLTYPIHK